jgi:hypothetical protein
MQDPLPTSGPCKGSIVTMSHECSRRERRLSLSGSSGYGSGSGQVHGRALLLGRFLVAVAMVVWALGVSASARAADSFSWSGQGTSLSWPGTDDWSEVGNWSGGVAPSGSVGTVAFPLLPAAICPTSGLGSVPCYGSDDETTGLSIGQLSFDDAAPYTISGWPISLGGGGISATTASTSAPHPTPTLEMPVTLTAGQSWTLDGGPAGVGGVYLFGGVTGSSFAVAVGLSSGASLGFGAGSEVGPVTITGADASDSGVDARANGSAGTWDLNASDGNPVTVIDARLRSWGTIGPLASEGADLVIGSGGSPGMLTVNGAVTLDSASAVEVPIPGDGSAPGPGNSYSQLSASGPIELGGAQLVLRLGSDPADVCPSLPVGEVDTLITTTSTLSGTFAGLPDGAVVSPTCAAAVPPTFRINYTSSSITATVLSTSRFPTHIDLRAAPSPAVASQPVTLTASVAAMTAGAPDNGNPAGTVAFDLGNQPIAGCTARPLSFGWPARELIEPEAVCNTSFSASQAPLTLTAKFIPTDPTTWDPSTGGDDLSVSHGSAQPTIPPDGDPFIATGSLHGLDVLKPSIQLELSSTHQNRAISGFAFRLPAGLTLNTAQVRSRRGVRIDGTNSLGVSAHGHQLTVSLRHATPRVRLRIASSALDEKSALARTIRRLVAFNRTHKSNKKRLAMTLRFRIRSSRHTDTDMTLRLTVV